MLSRVKDKRTFQKQSILIGILGIGMNTMIWNKICSLGNRVFVKLSNLYSPNFVKADFLGYNKNE